MPLQPEAKFWHYKFYAKLSIKGRQCKRFQREVTNDHRQTFSSHSVKMKSKCDRVVEITSDPVGQ
jgi:hypothetical protein